MKYMTCLVKRYSLSTAESDGPLNFVGSTYSKENDAVYDGLGRSGGKAGYFFAGAAPQNIPAPPDT